MSPSTYSLRFHPAVKKDLRKLTPDAVAHLKQEVFPGLGQDPQQGGILRGSFRNLRKKVVRFEGVSYRVIYQFDSRARSVIVLMVGPRGDFYDRLRRRLV